MSDAANDEGELELDELDKKELLRIARATLREFLTSGFMPPGAPHRKSLLQPRGAFVTLHTRGEPRGCIGRVDADTPLYLAVEQLSVAAATRDPRFPPLPEEDIHDTRIAISILSSLVPGGPDDIEVGRHGVVVTRGARRGLLLPQVATDQGLTREQFLDEACGKAGLPPGAWREGDTTIELFTAEVVSEPA